jgi:hypothetical protein
MKERDNRPALARWENEGGTVVHLRSPASTLGGMALTAPAPHPGAAPRSKHDDRVFEDRCATQDGATP